MFIQSNLLVDIIDQKRHDGSIYWYVQGGFILMLISITLSIFIPFQILHIKKGVFTTSYLAYQL